MSSDLEQRFRAAVAAHRAGDLAEAEAAYRAIIRDAPTLKIAYQNLVLILAAQSRALELAEVYRAMLHYEPTPELHYRLAICLLLAGRLREAWPHFEHRVWKAQQAPRTATAEWRGEPLAGRSLLVWQEQGFGDQIQMARFVPRLGAERVAYACFEPLRGLLDQVCPTVPHADAPADGFDFWVSSMSLPLRLAIGEKDLSGAPYLQAAPSWRAGRIGVRLAGNPAHPNDANRSLPAEYGRDLLAIDGAVSLDPADTGARDFAATAVLIAGLELVITVDTSVAHLAGAMGKPCWVLLPTKNVDWRWQLGRVDSPWYRTVRLFRQAAPGDWASVLAGVREALERWNG